MGTKLTEEQTQKLYKGECPDCGWPLLKGPRGGVAINVQCAACGSTFWVAPPPFVPERLP